MDAVEKWKTLSRKIESVDDLHNVTHTICTDALEQEAPPLSVLAFIRNIPNKEVQESAYASVAETIADSEQMQEKMYWKELRPYCQYAAEDLGPNSTATIKLFALQNQVRFKFCELRSIRY